MSSENNIPPQKGNGRRKGPWSQSEIERLKRSFGLKTDALIARDLNRSVESVRRMAKRVFSGEEKTGPWSAREVQALKNYIGVSSLESVSLILRRNPNEIQRKVEELQSLAASGPWVSDDIQVLKRLYGTRTNQDLVLILGRPESDIVEKANELCLAKDKGFSRRGSGNGSTPMPRWSQAEIERLRELYPITPNLQIAQDLNRSVKSIVSKAHDLNLKKSPERLQAMGRENVSLRYGKQAEQE
ncbi:MAG: hypothetical protein QGH51_09865 [Planctomycetota bacterium]|jgi:hypothetical protein|nr:hypothetical protein [Planctomycetota bacterium]MDP6942316.1 hypothetical protein [Planctomycetota bacterium]